MENRNTLYYTGNTLAAPQPSLDNLKRRRGKAWKDVRPMDYVHKVCATNKCLWCQAPFADYQIMCNVCNSCQYCGMIMLNKHKCHLCGNSLPEELQNNTDIKTFRF